ncbi:DNA polymerase III subunit chi [Aquabacterium sp. A08]|uniref:DNA polymerase III subunit chi n=1 Tax=Aquabacterium sp. A08 TaxID=2718532 RepID=UPI0014215703|nr:DNA polymerase III subunit chi [Aquabacterium sp. A08]NIC43392.1 DNA polymerase III subunit chi [Aquabacterium sp. A08]
MTGVAFHFNVPARVPYLCRLLRKVNAAGKSAWVRLPAAELAALDEALWTFSQEDFLAHAVAGQGTVAHSPIVLSDGAAPDRPGLQVLVNCLADIPAGFERHERVLEIVGPSDEERAEARQRWRQYSQWGYTLDRHDVAAQGGR